MAVINHHSLCALMLLLFSDLGLKALQDFPLSLFIVWSKLLIIFQQ